MTSSSGACPTRSAMQLYRCGLSICGQDGVCLLIPSSQVVHSADGCSQAPASRNTQETCTTYNALKLAQSLLRWTGNGSYADFYERALLNGILGTQRMPRSVESQAALPYLSPKADSSLADAIVPNFDARLGLRTRRVSLSRAIEGVGPISLHNGLPL